ncbi:MAG: hypothetical protein EOP61_10725 [Sphingomonadales bacterium]|nr:MAG: hypothetical protein EOP61_10725 [Sphingomonadales bacterium]
MDLIERYLGAVRWNLPTGKTDDILAELREVIESRIDDREAALGRSLDRSEISALLKEFGHPITVAGGYRDQRALIGAEVFPFYWFALRVVLAVVLVIEAVQFGARVIASGGPLAQTISQGIGGTVASLLLNAAIVTLAFAVIERTGWLSDYLQKWKPESLPSLPRIEARPRKIAEPIAGVIFGVAFLGWWMGAFHINWMPREADVLVQGAPIWTALYWPIAALVSVRVAFEAASLLVPTWKPVRALLAIACAGGTVALCAILYQAGRLFTVIPVNAGPEQLAHIQQGLDTAMQIGVPALGAITIFQCGVELWQIYRERRS